MRRYVARTAGLAVATMVLTLVSTPAQALGTGPAFNYTPVNGPIGTVITITKGGCTSAQMAGDAIGLYRASDGALVDAKVQLGNDPANRRPWTTTLRVMPTLTTRTGSTPATTRGAYRVALFCDIGSSFRPPSDPTSPTLLSSANLSKPFNVGRVPGRPGIGAATAGRGSATVAWTAPGPGSSPITGYQVQVVNAVRNVQVGALRPAVATARSLLVTGLVNGTAVKLRVRARNAVGTGVYSAYSAVVTPKTVPGAPVIGAASPGAVGGAVSAVARWTPPRSNGGSVVNGYVVTALRMSTTGTVVARTNSAVQSATVRSLSMALVAGRYRFVVRARNRVGLGANSVASNLVIAR